MQHDQPRALSTDEYEAMMREAAEASAWMLQELQRGSDQSEPEELL